MLYILISAIIVFQLGLMAFTCFNGICQDKVIYYSNLLPVSQLYKLMLIDVLGHESTP